jgi:4-amino-4-deoxy-L-arabinose transferase-like glycosyltransferase
LVFATGLFETPFVDEYAYINQSYYADLFFSGQTNDRAWLDRPAYDLQPLPKYLIGVCLHLARQPMPGRLDAHNWYLNYWQHGDLKTLVVARLPILALGALGCVAILGCGLLIKDFWVGGIAAVLLMLNPLYRLHAHRAMSDVPYESFTLVALGLGLWAWKRIWSGRVGVSTVLGALGAGVAAGLSVLCKFTGFLGLMVIVSWCGVALAAPALLAARKLVIAAASLLTVSTALCVVVALNPFLTARPPAPPPEYRRLAALGPWERFLFQVRYRKEASDWQKGKMSHNALYSMAERAKVFAVQGFGRFGPLGPSTSDSRVRYDLHQDLGMIIWAPCILIGLIESIRAGRSQLRSGQPPAAIALVVWAALAWFTVTFYLPMAWDRYLLPIQSPNALLAAVAATALWDRLKPHLLANRTRS